MEQVTVRDELYKLFELYKIVSENILLSYRGPLDKKVLNLLGTNVKTLLNDKPKVAKKIFKIFVELAQNIALYSAEQQPAFDQELQGVGIILVKDLGDSYEFVAGNYIKNPDLQKFLEKSNRINLMDKEELRKFKREQLMLPDGESGGANIGLVQAVLLSDNPLTLHVEPFDNEMSFLVIGVNVSKSFEDGKY
jgi:hypothetical protein